MTTQTQRADDVDGAGVMMMSMVLKMMIFNIQQVTDDIFVWKETKLHSVDNWSAYVARGRFTVTKAKLMSEYSHQR